MSDWKKIGTIRKSKQEPGKPPPKSYIKIDADVTLKAGTNLVMQDPRVKIQESLKAGRLTEERAQELLAKVPEYIRFELVLPPPKN